MIRNLTTLALGLLTLTAGACAPPPTPAECPKTIEHCGAGAETVWMSDGVGCTPCDAGMYCPDGLIVESCSDGTWDHDEDPTTKCVAWTQCDGDSIEGSGVKDRECIVGDSAPPKDEPSPPKPNALEPAITELQSVSADGRYVLFTGRGVFATGSNPPPSLLYFHDTKSKTTKVLDPRKRHDVISAALDPSGKFAIVQSASWLPAPGDETRPKDIALIDTATGKRTPLDIEAFQPRPLEDLQLTDRGKQLIFSVESYNGKKYSSKAIYRYDVATGALSPIATDGMNRKAMSSRDGKTVAYLGAQGMPGRHGFSYGLYWSKEGKLGHLDSAPGFFGRGFQLSGNGRFIAYDSSREEDGKRLSTVVVIDLGSRRTEEHCAVPQGSRQSLGCNAVALSNNGRHLLVVESGEEVPKVTLIDRATKKRTPLKTSAEYWHEAFVSDDAKQIVYEAHRDNTVTAMSYDVATGTATPIEAPKK